MRTCWYCILFFLTGILTPFCTIGQYPYSFRHLSDEEGLSQATVYCIHQDKDGFLWIGTADGLNRFDGITFTWYKHNPLNKNSLPAPTVLCIYGDSVGHLWIGTDGGGLVMFDKKKELFKVYKHDKSDENTLSNNKVWSICPINEKELAIGTFGGGANIFNKSSEKFRHLPFPADDPAKSGDKSISKILVSRNGIIWCATRNGLKYINSNSGESYSFKNNPQDPFSVPNNVVQEIYEDKDHQLWAGTFDGGICKFDSGNKKFFRYVLKFPDGESNKPIITSFLDDGNGNLWIGTYGSGIVVLNKKTGSYRFILNEPENKHSLSNNIIMCLQKDNSGILWIGTNGNGLNLYQPRYSNFNSLENLVRNHFSNKNVFSIYQDEKKILWIGTNGGGLYRLDNTTGMVNHFSTIKPKPQFLNSDEIWSINQDNDYALWIGCMGGGLNKLNSNNVSSQSFKKDTSDKNSLSINNVWSCYSDFDGDLWFGTQRGGINIFNTKENKFTHLKKNDQIPNTLNALTVYFITQDPDSLFYIGTQGGGLNLYDKKNHIFKHYINEPDNPYSISNNDVFSIYPANDNLVWIGTNGGGLNVFDKATKSFLCFTEEDNLPNNVIYGILPDNKGNLWLSTNNGICKFTPPAHLDFNTPKSTSDKLKPVVKIFNTSDGLPSNEFNQGAFHKSKDGIMYFGGIKGIAAFHPDSIKENPYIPQVVLTSFKVFEKNYLMDTTIYYKKKIVLNYNQDFFSFEFASLSYLFPEKNQYAYMMQGFDPDWNYSGNRRYASYTNLNPGEYDFKVKATNNDGIWSDKIASIHISITPPFWKTTWFKILSLVLLISAVIGFFRYRVNVIRKEEQKKAAFEKELAEVEMKALRAQMNPHFIFNSLNSINKYIWANDQASASDYLARFSRLIRLIFENSMHQSVPLSSDLEALDLYIQMERLRFENKLEYTIKVDESIDQEQVLVPPLIFQPFVENAILHGIMPKGSMGILSLYFRVIENELHVTIEDNGIGRAEAAEKNKSRGNHKSLGMKVTKDRLELLSQKKTSRSSVIYTDLINEKGTPSGTRVEITMPLELA